MDIDGPPKDHIWFHSSTYVHHNKLMPLIWSLHCMHEHLPDLSCEQWLLKLLMSSVMQILHSCGQF